MEVVRQWLTGVVCAALITALADGLMPKGAIKQIGKLVCALLILCALIRPAWPPELPDMVCDIHAEAEQQRSRLEQSGDSVLKTHIEQRSAAYIVDKAIRIGVNCQVRVECRPAEGGIWLPELVYIAGEMNAGQQAELSEVIRNEFGIAPECQVYTGGE